MNIQYSGFKLLITFLGISLVFGIINTELLLTTVEPGIKSLTRMSSYVSLVMGGFLSAGVISLVLISVYYLNDLILKGVNDSVFYQSSRNYIVVLAGGQLINSLLFIYFVYEPSLYIDSANSLYEHLRESNWNQISSLANIVIILISIIVMSSSLYLKENRLKNMKVAFTFFLMVAMQLTLQFKSLKEVI